MAGETILVVSGSLSWSADSRLCCRLSQLWLPKIQRMEWWLSCVAFQMLGENKWEAKRRFLLSLVGHLRLGWAKISGHTFLLLFIVCDYHDDNCWFYGKTRTTDHGFPWSYRALTCMKTSDLKIFLLVLWSYNLSLKQINFFNKHHFSIILLFPKVGFVKFCHMSPVLSLKMI